MRKKKHHYNYLQDAPPAATPLSAKHSPAPGQRKPPKQTRDRIDRVMLMLQKSNNLTTSPNQQEHNGCK